MASGASAEDPSTTPRTKITMSITAVLFIFVTIHALIAMRTASREPQP